MEFDLEKTEQALMNAVRIKEGEGVNWVRSVNGMNSSDLHNHFEVELSNAPKLGEKYVIASLEVPNYKTAASLLGKFGIISEKLIGYLETSFPEDKSQYLIISNWHINWNDHQN